MFDDINGEIISIKSTWEAVRDCHDSQTQTSGIDAEDKSNQSVRKKHKETETEIFDTECVAVVKITKDLVQFVKSVENLFIEQLKSNYQSHAFDGYSVQWEEETEVVTAWNTLKCPETLHIDKIQVTSLCWSASGGTITIAYGHHNHESWCTHKSAICAWLIDKRNLSSDKPDFILDVSSCVTSLASHPNNPSILCCGTYNGEVIVWDLSKENESLVASTGVSDDTHTEPVTSLVWTEASSSKSKKYFNIVSVSSDGKMLEWKIDSNHKLLKIVNGFILLKDSLPASLQVENRDQEMGVTCISYNKFDSSTFVVGSESGAVLRCSSTTQGRAASSTIISSIPLRSPVNFSFKPHIGPVYSIEFSPFNRNLFVTCGIDNSARIYSMLQTEPLLTLEPNLGYLFSAHWSPVRPMVLSIGCEDGQLLIYDLKENLVVPKHTLSCHDAKNSLYDFQFNYKRNFIACGYADGTVTVWNLNDDLTHQINNENELLESMANTFLSGQS